METIKKEYLDKYISGNGLKKTKVSDIKERDFEFIKGLGFKHIFTKPKTKKKKDDKADTIND